jgi:predicted rRNA methylase YqxC with S4 and FtsJ domains
MRLDKYLFEQKLAESRSKALHLIKTGKVFVNGREVNKQSCDIGDSDRV